MNLKKNTLLLGIAALIIAGIAACNQAPSKKQADSGTAWYRNLLFSETPWDTERGTRQLTADEAKEINSYKFSYDETGRLLSVEFVRGDELLSYGSLGGAAKITYEYADNKQIKRFFDENNEQIESGGVFTAEYTLDEKGTRTIRGCIPGEPVFVNGIVIGRAAGDEVVLRMDHDTIVPVRGLVPTAHGMEKLLRSGIPDISTAWCRQQSGT